MDIEPLKALGDSRGKDDEANSPSLEGEQFGYRLAIGVAVVLFFIFLVGTCKG